MEEMPVNSLKNLCATFVVSHIILFVFLVQFFIIFLLFTPFYFGTLLYIAWIFYDRKTPHTGGRRNEWVRSWSLWKYVSQYFPIHLVKSAELDPKENYVCGFHPHGSHAIGALSSFSTDGTNFSKLFPGITPRVISHSLIFLIATFREALMAFGHCASTKESISYVLKKKGRGNAVVLMVGGVKEMFTVQPFTMTLKLKDRKGFVRLAVKNGAHLVPIITFGENEVLGPLIGQSLVNYLGTRLHYFVCLWALVKFFIPRMPKRTPVTIVVGKPIEVVKDENASEEVIDQFHQQYIQSLQQLFDKYKLKVGDKYKDMELTLF